MRQKAHIVALSVYRICRLARLLCRGSLRRAGDIRIPIPEDNRTRRTKFVPVEGFAYATPPLAHFTPTGAQSTSARLYEDARVSSLYSQRTTSVSRIGRRIFCFPEKGRLLLYNFCFRSRECRGFVLKPDPLRISNEE
jgi:hypothetical protein